jgi:hypothetical protein
MRVKFLVALLLAASLGSHAHGATIERIDIVDTGIYAIETGAATADESTPTGEITAVTTARNIDATDTVAAAPGLEFGFRYILVGEPHGDDATLDMVVTYPQVGLKDPDAAERLFESRYTQTKTVGDTWYMGYGFENDWEMVPGTWVFQIWFEGHKLAEQRFTVTN